MTLLGVADHYTGFETSFAVFYLLPVALAAWYGGSAAGFSLCAISAVTWLLVDFSAGHVYSRSWIPYWNAGTRFVFFLATAWLLARLRQSVAAKETLLRKDALTGVHSLRAFMDESATLLELAARHGHPVALGYIDLDGFKSLNDGRGHAEGDRALRRVGAELGRHVRASDIAARLGGDEFAVLLPHADRRGAEVFFGRLHARLLEAMEEEGWAIGFSVGVAVFDDPGIGVGEMLKRADALMYSVKKAGKNSVSYRVFPADDG